MHLPFIAAPLMLALLGAQVPAPSPAAPSAPLAPRSTCYYEPSGSVFIGIGEVQTFFADLDSCSGLNVSISPANGVAGFSSGTACTKTSVVTGSAGIFKVRGCSAGSVTVTVSSGHSVLQTIYVTVAAPV